MGVLVCVLMAIPGLATAQSASDDVDELLADGWHRYSEELDFEGAIQAYEAVTQSPNANENQLLEAYEYLAACRFALGDTDGARQALSELLRINPDQQLNDPSHSPDLLQLLEDLRQEAQAEPELPPEPEPPVDVERPPGMVEQTPAVDTEAEGHDRQGGRRPWYRTWWFWTITGVVVVSAVTVGAVLGTRGSEPDYPQGSLDPGVVSLPLFEGRR